MCDTSLPIGSFPDGDASDNLIPAFPVVDIGDASDSVRASITASVAVKIDGFSLMVVAYSSSTDSHSIGIVGFIWFLYYYSRFH